MAKKLKRFLYLLMLLSGGMLAVQCFLLLGIAGPVTLNGFGTVSQSMISGFFVQVILICSVLVVMSLLTFQPRYRIDPTKKMSSLLIMLIAGSLCCLEGVVSINLSAAVVTGINSTFLITFGVQLFCLGIISIAAFVAAKGRSNLIRNVPNYYALMFFILLIPAAFLIGNLN